MASDKKGTEKGEFRKKLLRICDVAGEGCLDHAGQLLSSFKPVGLLHGPVAPLKQSRDGYPQLSADLADRARLIEKYFRLPEHRNDLLRGEPFPGHIHLHRSNKILTQGLDPYEGSRSIVDFPFSY